MLEDLRKKTEDLVISVYKLGVTSKSLDEVKLEDIEPELAQELNDVDTRIFGISQEIDQLAIDQANVIPAAEIISKVNKIIDETDALDSQIMAIPRPRNRIGRPKYYERVRFIIAKIEQITKKVASLQDNLSKSQAIHEGDPFDEKNPPKDPRDGFDDRLPVSE